MKISNTEIARRLQQHARELRKRHDNLFRVRAFGQAADALLRLDVPVEELVQQGGRVALEELPGIGRNIARSIERFVETGKWELQNEDASE